MDVYVSREEYDQLLDVFAELDEQVTRYQAQDRERGHRAAFGRVADRVGISPEFRDDLYDLVSFHSDAEPDEQEWESKLSSWLDAKPSRSKYLADPDAGRRNARGDDQGDGDEGSPWEPKPIGRAGPRLRAEDSGDAGRGRGRGGDRAGGQFRYRSDDLSDHDWTQKNGPAYAKAVAEGRAVKVG